MVSYGVAMLHLGNMANKEEEWEKAIDYYEQSMEIGERIGYRELQTRSVTNMGIVFRKMGVLKRSHELLVEAESLAESWARSSFKADLHLEFGYLARAEAEIQSGKERESRLLLSRERLMKAIAIYKELNHDRIGEIEEELKKLDEALNQDRSVAE